MPEFPLDAHHQDDAGSSLQTCPQAPDTRKPCHLTSLTVDLQPNKSASAKADARYAEKKADSGPVFGPQLPQDVTTFTISKSNVREREQATECEPYSQHLADWSAERKGKAQCADFYIQRVGDQVSGGTMSEPFVLNLTATPAATCNENHSASKGLTFVGNKSSGKTLKDYKLAMPVRRSDALQLRGVHDFVLKMLDHPQTQRYSAGGVTCGADPEGKDPLGAITGIIEIIPQNLWSLELTMDHLFKRADKLSNDYVGKTTSSEKTRYKKGKTVTVGTENDVIVSRSVSSRTATGTTTASASYHGAGESNAGLRKGPAKVENGSAWDIIICHNADKLSARDSFKTAVELIEIMRGVKNMIDDFKSFIPKIGFFFDLNFGALNGSLKLTSELYQDYANSTAHYQWIARLYSYNFKIGIFDIGLSFGFGIKASSPGAFDWIVGAKAFDLDISLAFTFSLALEVAVNGTTKPDDPGKKAGNLAEIKGTSKTDLTAKGSITLGGLTASVVGKIEGGFEAYLGITTEFAGSADMKSLPITFTICTQTPGDPGSKERYKGECAKAAMHILSNKRLF